MSELTPARAMPERPGLADVEDFERRRREEAARRRIRQHASRLPLELRREIARRIREAP